MAVFYADECPYDRREEIRPEKCNAFLLMTEEANRRETFSQQMLKAEELKRYISFKKVKCV